MREKERIDRICKLIKEQWKKYPDQRLGQLLINYVFGDSPISGKYTHYIWSLEDDIIEKRLKEKWIRG